MRPMTSAFKDHFSGHAATYRAARPIYPPALAALVADLAPRRARVWDVGTGNGQLAELLAERFDAVFASDASERQIAEARAHERILYAHEPAEAPSLPASSVDAITVAQAAHWLDLERFYGAVRRVARPGAPLVIAGYDLCQITVEVDPIVKRFANETVGPDWPPERAILDARYRTIAFPFEELAVGPVEMTHRWTREEFVAYVGSWSAVQRNAKRTGVDPMPGLEAELAAVWPAGEPRDVRWDLALRAGRVG